LNSKVGDEKDRPNVPFGTILDYMDLAKNLKIESVSRLNLAAPPILAPHDSVRRAVQLMQKQHLGALLVCQDRQVVGIFTERDLLKRIIAANRSLETPLEQCMTPSPVTVNDKEAIGLALRRMQEGGYRHLPVVDRTGHPIGMLTVKRIVRYLVEHFPATVYNQPPDPDVVQQDREGA
jgi:CBS domain-containing protein